MDAAIQDNSILGIFRVYSGYITRKYTRFRGYSGAGISRVYVLFGGYIPDAGMLRVYKGYIKGIIRAYISV